MIFPSRHLSVEMCIRDRDMDRAYGDERNPIVSKSEFVLSLFEQLIGDGKMCIRDSTCTAAITVSLSSAVFRCQTMQLALRVL